MQAILFPFTYVSEAVCEAVRTCFQPIRVYQPTRRQVPPLLQALSQKGLIDIASPAGGDDKRIETLVRDYRSWAELHPGGVLDYLKRERESIPFFDDTATAQIKAHIRQPARAPEGNDPLFNARVFLQFAQEYDLQVDDIARKLGATNQAQQKLFKNITGESDGPGRNGLRPQTGEGMNSAGYMPVPRTLAWAQLFLQDAAFDPAAAPGSAFITLHREPLDLLIERSPGVKCVLRAASLPVMHHLSEEYDAWQGSFSRILDLLPENADALAADLSARFQAAQPSSPKVALTLYRIPGESPAVVFARCIDRPPPETDGDTPGGRDDTLIGLMELT